MKSDQVISEIIEQSAPDLITGKETIETILEKHPQYAGELQKDLEAVQWLQGARIALATRPGYINDSRKYLERQIACTPSTSFWQRILKRYTPQHWAFYITAPVLIIVLLALIINSLLLTARLALPGDTLYSTKIFVENVRLALTIDPAKKAELYVQHTRERSSEFVDLVLDGNYAALPSAAGRMETAVIYSLHSLNSLQAQHRNLAEPLSADLREILSSERVILTLLKGSSPPSADPGIDQVLSVTQSGLFALR